MDEDFPRGPGDPDTYGYPGEHDADCQMLKTGKGPDCDCNYGKVEA